MPKVNSKTKLSHSSIDQLITEVKEYQCLWNHGHSSYSDRRAVANAWTAISEKMNLPVEFLKTKWKNLRDMYMKILKRCKTPEAFDGSWRYFQQLTFLVRSVEEVSDGGEDIAFESLYEDESPVSEANFKLEVNDVSSDEDPILPTPEKKRKVQTKDDDEDFDIMFLKSLAPYFKKLDLMRKLVVRSRMQDMLMNEIAAQRNEKFKRSMGDV